METETTTPLTPSGTLRSMATKVFCYRASFNGYEAFGATRLGAVKILEEVVRMREGAREAARAERDATVCRVAGRPFGQVVLQLAMRRGPTVVG